MNQPAIWRKLISPGGFLLVLICFALPFLTVSCEYPGGAITLDYTGGDLLVGGGPDTTGVPPIGSRSDDLDAQTQPLAILAFLACLVGLGIGLLTGQGPGRAAAGLSSATAAGLLLILNQVKIVGEVEDRIEVPGGFPRGAGAQMVETRYGFWLALTLLGLVVAWHGYELVSRTGPDSVPAPGAQPHLE